MSVAELEERMPPDEFDQWRAYDLYVQPIGDQRLARQLTMLAWLYANAHRGKREAFDLDEFDLYRAPTPTPTRLTRAQEEARFVAAWRNAGLLVDQTADRTN